LTASTNKQVKLVSSFQPTKKLNFKKCYKIKATAMRRDALTAWLQRDEVNCQKLVADVPTNAQSMG